MIFVEAPDIDPLRSRGIHVPVFLKNHTFVNIKLFVQLRLILKKLKLKLKNIVINTIIKYKKLFI